MTADAATATSNQEIGALIDQRSLAVVAGTGGVGKTTMAAALAIGAARRDQDRSVLVLTIDPARRLASALGMEIDGNEANRVDFGRSAGATRGRSGLYAAMLDPGPAWDEMVRAEAPSTSVADQILRNPVYRQIADTFVHGNDYAALGWLADALDSDAYDLIIVDTPPSQNALGLFDAPERVAEFFTSSLLGWLTKGESGRIIGGPAARTFGGLADRLLGGEFFGDIVEFFQLMQTVVPGMVERTRSVADRLVSDDAAFIAVAAPSERSIVEAGVLFEELEGRNLGLDGLIVNGVEPSVYWNPKVADVAERVIDGERSPFSASSTGLLRPGAEYVAQQARVATAQAARIAELDAPITATIPRRVHSPSNLAELISLGDSFWPDPAVP